MDESTRRLLRFCLFLQGFAFLMMGGALIVRALILGWDVVTWILTALLIVIAGAGVWTVNRLRRG
ncbi:MAG TPA: hypothetical protein DCQ36_03660 [Actinobacteria bacterium]|jgi:hypothetical protein|nr:hypothetical protein [Actinomycetota bacterium]